MNMKDIKKALIICAGDDCDNCPYYVFHICYDKLKLDARGLIIKQEQEIRQLKTECTLLDDELRNARQETINVLNALKENIKGAIDTYYNKDGGGYYLAEDVINDIDDFIKELIKNAEDKGQIVQADN